MRGNPDGSLSSRVRLRRRRCSLSGYLICCVSERVFSPPCLGVVSDKVMAGGTPANPATLVPERPEDLLRFDEPAQVIAVDRPLRGVTFERSQLCLSLRGGQCDTDRWRPPDTSRVGRRVARTRFE